MAPGTRSGSTPRPGPNAPLNPTASKKGPTIDILAKISPEITFGTKKNFAAHIDTAVNSTGVKRKNTEWDGLAWLDEATEQVPGATEATKKAKTVPQKITALQKSTQAAVTDGISEWAMTATKKDVTAYVKTLDDKTQAAILHIFQEDLPTTEHIDLTSYGTPNARAAAAASQLKKRKAPPTSDGDPAGGQGRSTRSRAPLSSLAPPPRPPTETDRPSQAEKDKLEAERKEKAAQTAAQRKEVAAQAAVDNAQAALDAAREQADLLKEAADAANEDKADDDVQLVDDAPSDDANDTLKSVYHADELAGSSVCSVRELFYRGGRKMDEQTLKAAIKATYEKAVKAWVPADARADALTETDPDTQLIKLSEILQESKQFQAGELTPPSDKAPPKLAITRMAMVMAKKLEAQAAALSSGNGLSMEARTLKLKESAAVGKVVDAASSEAPYGLSPPAVKVITDLTKPNSAQGKLQANLVNWDLVNSESPTTTSASCAQMRVAAVLRLPIPCTTLNGFQTDSRAEILPPEAPQVLRLLIHASGKTAGLGAAIGNFSRYVGVG